MMNDELSLEQLADESGLPIRTLRFYIQEGLLPGPETRGKNATYSRDHLEIIKFIIRLKDLHLPLNEIRHLLSVISLEEVKQIIQMQDQMRPTPTGNLADYIKFLPKNLAEDRQEYEVKPESNALEYIQNLNQANMQLEDIRVSKSDALSPMINFYNQTRGGTKSEIWERIELADGIEIHIREGLRKIYRAKVDQIIVYIQTLLGKNKGVEKNEREK